MSVLDKLHGRHHHRRRLRVQGERLGALIPAGASVLDVGCGDGLLTRFIADQRSDVKVTGVDVLVRGETHVPVDEFDGETLPHGSDSFGTVMLVDVLHHTQHPEGLLAEAARVGRRCVVVKDHTLQGVLARPTLRFMDRTSNLRHGVSLPCTYWEPARWRSAFAELSLDVEVWDDDLRLYPWWSRWIFERSLHFVARLVAL